MAETKFAAVPDKLAKKRAEAGEPPDMVHVKLKKAQPGRLEGDVLYVDINSAGHLVGRGDAEFVDPDTVDEVPIAVARGRANVQTMVVKSSDLPVAAAGGDATATAEVVETGTGAGTVVEGESKPKRGS